jgi:hypothetical protein
VRVVEYSLGDDAAEPETTYGLLTTMLDHEKAPAEEFAALYRELWEIESAFDELKSHQRSPRVVLHSKMPEGSSKGSTAISASTSPQSQTPFWTGYCSARTASSSRERRAETPTPPIGQPAE